MATFNEMKAVIMAALKDKYDGPECRTIATWLLSSVTGIERMELFMYGHQEIDAATQGEIMAALGDLVRYKPVQYVTGKAFFYGLELEVGPGVLIPRPETEELVQWVSDDYAGIKNLRILDIGTGSGCIALSLGKQLKDPVLTAVDISADAIRMAGRNAASLGVPVNFHELDIFDDAALLPWPKFNIIVSNPPYVRNSEKVDMKPNVLEYEPPVALFVNDHDPLVFYRAIAAFAHKNLEKSGRLYVEINEAFGPQTASLFRDAGFNDVVLKQDIRGKDRMVRAGF